MLNAHAVAEGECGEAASSFSLPPRRKIVGGTCSNAKLIGTVYGRVRLLGRGLFRAHRTTRGAAAAD